MKRPPDWKLKKILTSQGTKVTLHKVTSTVTDDEFGQATETEVEHTIYAELQGITLEDIMFSPAGMLSEGDMWGYFLPVYELDGDSVYAEVNDYVSFKTIKYLIVKIIDDYMKGETVIRKALLKRQVGV